MSPTQCYVHAVMEYFSCLKARYTRPNPGSVQNGDRGVVLYMILRCRMIVLQYRKIDKRCTGYHYQVFSRSAPGTKCTGYHEREAMKKTRTAINKDYLIRYRLVRKELIITQEQKQHYQSLQDIHQDLRNEELFQLLLDAYEEVHRVHSEPVEVVTDKKPTCTELADTLMTIYGNPVDANKHAVDYLRQQYPDIRISQTEPSSSVGFKLYTLAREARGVLKKR
jgi:hypothetical protein